MPSFWGVKISQLRGMSPSVCFINTNKKHLLLQWQSCTQKELTQVWENNQFKYEGLKLPNIATVFCYISSSQWWHGQCPGTCGRDPRVKQQQIPMNTVWWQWLIASRLIALYGGLLSLTTHWGSWRCLPWLSSNCSGLAGPCHAPLFAHWWVDHIVLLWQTAKPQWKNAWIAPHHPSPSMAHYRALSSHPDNRLHLPHQKHSLPGRHRW